MSRPAMTLVPLLLTLLATCPPRPARAAEAEAVSLRPLAVDLRRLYPRLDGRWRAADDGAFARRGGVYHPSAGFLAAPGLSSAPARAARSLAALPKAADGLFVLSAGGVTIERRLLGASHARAVTERGLLRYPAAFPHAEALYVADGKAERFVLLTEPGSPLAFEERLRVRGGRLAADPGAGLAVLDAAGRRALRLPAPRVLDAEGRSRAAAWRVSGGAHGVYTVQVGIDPSGLEYPLLLIH